MLMKNTPIVISPSQVPADARIIIRTASDLFNGNSYVITNESGKTVRRGTISSGIKEFYLSVVGMSLGNYYVSVGAVREKFTVI